MTNSLVSEDKIIDPNKVNHARKNSSGSQLTGGKTVSQYSMNFKPPKIDEKIDKWASYSFPMDRNKDDPTQQLNFGSMNWVLDNNSNKVDEIEDESDYNSEEMNLKKTSL